MIFLERAHSEELEAYQTYELDTPNDSPNSPFVTARPISARRCAEGMVVEASASRDVDDHWNRDAYFEFIISHGLRLAIYGHLGIDQCGG